MSTRKKRRLAAGQEHIENLEFNSGTRGRAKEGPRSVAEPNSHLLRLAKCES